MKIRNFLPFHQGPVKSPKKTATTVLPPNDQKLISKLFKVASLAVGFDGIPYSGSSRSAFETPPYDFHQIIQAVDTDSYVRQAFSKYQELFWKEGFDIVSENPDAVTYIWERIDFMEVAMRRPFQEFLMEVIDQLVKFSNVFIVKARGDLAQFFPGPLHMQEGQKPIIGYYVLPTEQIEILRDKNNRPRWYRQRIDDNMVGTSANMPTWNAKEVIHLTLDKKPGRAFGTPFLISAMDDILALRQLEEDIQNLIHKELFPLYKFTVGTELLPAEPDELERAADQIESMRTEGALILPERYDVDVVGAEGKALDAAPYLDHFKQRVAIGLGLYPHHLGMNDGGNRAATDRLDTALYDRIKMIQKRLADNIRLFIFNEILIEGGFDPYDNPANADESDRCFMKFNEIDVDSQVKKESHEITKMTSNAKTIPETRLALGEKPQMNESETIAALQSRMAPDTISQGKNKDGTPSAPKLIDTTPVHANKDAQAPSKGGRANLPNVRKAAGNIVRPANQHGRRTSPNIRRFDVDDVWLKEVEELLTDDIIEE
jgi:hypothetical protein